MKLAKGMIQSEDGMEMEGYYAVEVWHGHTQVYVDLFYTQKAAEAYKQNCLNDHERRAYGWNRYVSEVMEFESFEAFAEYREANEGSY